MKHKPVPKWVLSVWIGGAILFGLANVYGLARGSFEWRELAVFVLFASLALDTWRRRQKSDQG